MHLHALLDDAAVLELTGDSHVDVSDITHDSRRVSRGALFCCIRGRAHDGHDHAAAAVSGGAVALLVDRLVTVTDPVTQVRVERVRSAIGPIASRFYGDPSHAMRVLGITGTNGKTTTTYLLEAIARAAGDRTGVIGTTGARIAGVDEPLAFTTPEATGAAAGAGPHARRRTSATVAMEVSSHALGVRAGRRHPVRRRVLHQPLAGSSRRARNARGVLRSEGAAVHPGVQRHPPRSGSTTSGEAGSRRAPATRDSTCGRSGSTRARRCARPTSSWMPKGRRCGSSHPPGRPRRVRLGARRRVQRPERAWPRPRPRSRAGSRSTRWWPGCSRTSSVPGRMERVSAGPAVHRAGGLRARARPRWSACSPSPGGWPPGAGCSWCSGAVATGTRRSGRRWAGPRATPTSWCSPPTTRAPRTRPRSRPRPRSGCASGDATYAVELDRRRAIRQVLGEARPGDVVVIAGKGHEQGQNVGGVVTPFDDRVVAREELEARGMDLTRDEIAAITGGRPHGGDGAPVVVRGFGFDSRTIAAGRGLPRAAATRATGTTSSPTRSTAGAALAIVERVPDGVTGPLVVVDDTQTALYALGVRGSRPRLEPATVIGITGSAGKTSTKDLTAAALAPGFAVHASEASFNNEIGLPVTLLAAPAGTEAVVLEMGARFAGNIRELCAIGPPVDRRHHEHRAGARRAPRRPGRHRRGEGRAARRAPGRRPRGAQRRLTTPSTPALRAPQRRPDAHGRRSRRRRRPRPPTSASTTSCGRRSASTRRGGAPTCRARGARRLPGRERGDGRDRSPCTSASRSTRSSRASVAATAPRPGGWS